MEAAVTPVTGRVKWFDNQRGFGFLICDAFDGDVMIHKTRLQGHKHKRLPEGAVVEFTPMKGAKGVQVDTVLSVDLTYAVPDRPASSRGSRKELIGAAGDWEPCTFKWFHGEKGFGFITRESDGEDAFVHAATLSAGHMRGALAPGDKCEARIGTGPKGLIAACIRWPQ